MAVRLMCAQKENRPGTVTVTFKLKHLWLIVGIIMLLLSVSPIVYLYTGGQTTTTPSGGGGGGGTPSGPTPNCQVVNNVCKIVIKNSVFGTGQLVVVKAGTTVIWVNADDTTHTATSTSGVWDTGILAPGQSSKPVTLSNPGDYHYICQVHPMSGDIDVVA